MNPLLVYPPPPEKGRITVRVQDYTRLYSGRYLNDVIINFYLKYVVNEILSAEDRARTYVFDSFFYTSLAISIDKHHSNPMNWTKHVDIFSKDFIVIPINEDVHWYLAIICFPGLMGPVRFLDNTPIDIPARKKKKTEDKAGLSAKHTVTIGSTINTANKAQGSGAITLDLGDEVEDRDKADGKYEHIDVSNEYEEKTVPEVKEEPDGKKPTNNAKRDPIKQPSILIFDSLGRDRSKVVTTLRTFLHMEYEMKHGGETRDFSDNVMEGINVECPKQTNNTDCGLYLLQYVEAFFKWPITDFTKPISQVKNWFQADIVSRKRYDIQQIIMQLSKEQNMNVEDPPPLNLSADMGMRYAGSEAEE